MVQSRLSLTWTTDDPVWVDQWPLNAEELHHLNQLVEEQFRAGHIIPTTSPWSSPVFAIKKKGGKWRLLRDLQQINAVLNSVGAGLASPPTLGGGPCSLAD